MFWNKPKKPTVEKLTPLDKIKDYCKQEMITLNQLEKKCGIPENTIITWDKKAPSPKHIANIALTMKVSPFWLEKGKLMNKSTFLSDYIRYVVIHTDEKGFENIMNVVFEEANKLSDNTNNKKIINIKDYKKM